MKHYTHKISLLIITSTLIGSEYLTAMKRERPEEPGAKVIWVHTSDDKLMKVPKWQIDQMRVLYVLLTHQKGKNSEETPIEITKSTEGKLQLTSQELDLLQIALQ